jgi:acetyl-CoA acetyltransferase
LDYHSRQPNHPPVYPARWALRMLFSLVRTLVKVAVASLVVGTVLAHFGVTADELLRASGLTTERLAEYARQSVAWALPNLLIGSIVIVPIWFVAYLLRPPGQSRSD